MFSYFRSLFIGSVCGAIIGNQLAVSLGFVSILSRGYYVSDDPFFVWVGNGLFIGMPVGFIVGIIASVILLQYGIKARYIALLLGVLALSCIALTVQLDERIRLPLVKASYFNQLVQVKRAIEHGVNPNVKDINGQTALIVASRQGFLDIVDMLIEAGADVNIKDNQGLTALMNAFFKETDERIEIVKSLIQAGANVNDKNIKGLTALMLAGMEGDVINVKILIQAGADVDAKDDRDMSVLDLVNQNNSEAKQILREAGARE